MRAAVTWKVPIAIHVPDNPSLQDVCKLEIVVVHHQHVTVALDAEIRQQQELRIATRLLERRDGSLASLPPIIAVRTHGADTVVAPERQVRHF